MTADQSWHCRSCGTTLTTAYCPTCGEGTPCGRDLTLRGLVLQLFHALTEIDGRFISSFRSLLFQPGALTHAYLEGRKKPYLPPFQLFLLANLAFFAIQSMTHINIVGSPLSSHLQVQDWHALATALVEQKLRSNGLTLEAYAPLFDQANQFHARSLIVLMVLPLALMVAVLCHRRERPFAAHLVFSVHFYSFLLLLYSLALLGAEADILLGGKGLDSAVLDTVVTVTCSLLCAAYLFLAVGRVYAGPRLLRTVQAVVLAGVVLGILLGYRFLLFLAALATT